MTSILGLGGGPGLLAAGEAVSAATVAGLTFGGPAMRAMLLSRLGQRLAGKPKPEVTGTSDALAGVITSGELAGE